MDFWVIREILERAFHEDMPMGDITTDCTVPENSVSKAVLIAKQEGVIAGIDVCIEAFKMLDPKVKLRVIAKDGDFVEKAVNSLLLKEKQSTIKG